MRQIRRHTLPPFEKKKKQKQKQWGKKFSFLYICGASTSVTYTAECTVLSNTDILSFLLCLYIIQQKHVMAQ